MESTSLSLKERCRLITLGLAVGDSLGSTSEFMIPWDVGMLISDENDWPNKQIGRGRSWAPGEPTDDSDMAIAIVRAVLESNGKLVPETVLNHFLKWLRSGPKDVGGTTRRSLMLAGKSKHWADGGKSDYQHNPSNAANGSLMRNGVIPALFPQQDQEMEALDATVLHAIITHYSPLPTICCAIQTLLIRKALHSNSNDLKPPTLDDIQELLNGPWKLWKQNTTNLNCKTWIETVGMRKIELAELKLLDELKGFEDYDPYEQDYRGRSGYCVLTLLLSLWSLHWSFRDDHPKLPKWLPEWPFKKHKFETLLWVVLIGADADTYGATAGPLLAAYHPHIPDNLVEKLFLKEEIIKSFQ